MIIHYLSIERYGQPIGPPKAPVYSFVVSTTKGVDGGLSVFQELAVGDKDCIWRFMTRERSDMEEKDWDLLEEADWHFRKVVRRFVKERDKISVEGISLPGLLILNTIFRDGEQRLGELAEQLDFTSGAVTAICDTFIPYLWDVYLAENGVAFSDVELIGQGGFDEAYVALKQGDIDAAWARDYTLR